MTTTVSPDRKRLFDWMLEDSTTPLPLDQFTSVVTEDRNLYGMPWGCVIDQKGQIHQLHYYATHGAIAAILCPEEAESFGAPQPTGRASDLPVMAYQEFELERAYRMPLVRISTRFGINISHGRGDYWPNKEQQDALRRFLVANDAMGDEVRTEVTARSRGQAYLQLLQLGEVDSDYVTEKDDRKAREQAENMERYKLENPDVSELM